MSPTKSEILLHPVRMRIVLAFGSEQLTTTELGARLPDIAHATLYRQVAALMEAGVLEIVEERRVRGGVERTYALVAEAVRMGPEDTDEMSSDELLRGFTVFAGMLIESFGRYLEHPAADPRRDPVSYRQAALWLDESERSELVERLRAAIEPYLANEPAAERQRVLLDTILIPDFGASAASGRDDEEGDR